MQNQQKIKLAPCRRSRTIPGGRLEPKCFKSGSILKPVLCFSGIKVGTKLPTTFQRFSVGKILNFAAKCPPNNQQLVLEICDFLSKSRIGVFAEIIFYYSKNIVFENVGFQESSEIDN
jgi:hypothetical protein